MLMIDHNNVKTERHINLAMIEHAMFVVPMTLRTDVLQ